MKVFEQSWEVCNKVGGIYTVISSKAKYLVNKYGDNYFLIGPYLKDTQDFYEMEKPVWLENISNKLEKEYDIKIYYGKWLIEGKPNTILIDFYKFFEKERNLWKYKFWEWYKIDTLNSDYTYDEPFIWSVSVGILLEEIDKIFREKKVLHSHEWLSGGTILYVKKKGLNYKTIFTIHGTVIGRNISSRGFFVEKIINNLDPDKDSYRLGIHYKHQMEKNSILYSDIFTVVSDILSYESEKLFNRRPDKIIYNCLDIKERDVIKEYIENRKKLVKFVSWYFLPYYDLDIENSIFIYTLGRYEIFNKGYDLIIKIFSEINKRKLNKNIFLFIFVPYQNNGVNKKIIRLYSEYNKLISYINKEETIFNFIKNKKLELKELNLNFEVHGNPEISTHDVNNEIINLIKENGFGNRKEDPVKIIYVPAYIGQDIIFPYEMDKFLSGFDIGIFLSRYEPYGYTNLEALSYGIPIIISNKSGFYNAIKNKNLLDEKIILPVDVEDFNGAVEKIYNYIKFYSNLNHEEIYEIREKAYTISKNFSWEKNINEYINLYEQ